MNKNQKLRLAEDFYDDLLEIFNKFINDESIKNYSIKNIKILPKSEKKDVYSFELFGKIIEFRFSIVFKDDDIFGEISSFKINNYESSLVSEEKIQTILFDRYNIGRGYENNKVTEQKYRLAQQYFSEYLNDILNKFIMLDEFIIQ